MTLGQTLPLPEIYRIVLAELGQHYGFDPANLTAAHDVLSDHRTTSIAKARYHLDLFGVSTADKDRFLTWILNVRDLRLEKSLFGNPPIADLIRQRRLAVIRDFASRTSLQSFNLATGPFYFSTNERGSDVFENHYVVPAGYFSGNQNYSFAVKIDYRGDEQTLIIDRNTDVGGTNDLLISVETWIESRVVPVLANTDTLKEIKRIVVYNQYGEIFEWRRIADEPFVIRGITCRLGDYAKRLLNRAKTALEYYRHIHKVSGNGQYLGSHELNESLYQVQLLIKSGSSLANINPGFLSSQFEILLSFYSDLKRTPGLINPAEIEDFITSSKLAKNYFDNFYSIYSGEKVFASEETQRSLVGILEIFGTDGQPINDLIQFTKYRVIILVKEILRGNYENLTTAHNLLSNLSRNFGGDSVEYGYIQQALDHIKKLIKLLSRPLESSPSLPTFEKVKVEPHKPLGFESSDNSFQLTTNFLGKLDFTLKRGESLEIRRGRGSLVKLVEGAHGRRVEIPHKEIKTRLHALLSRGADGTLSIMDSGSKNGVRILHSGVESPFNGFARMDSHYPLFGEDEIYLGAVKLQITQPSQNQRRSGSTERHPSVAARWRQLTTRRFAQKARVVSAL